MSFDDKQRSACKTATPPKRKTIINLIHIQHISISFGQATVNRKKKQQINEENLDFVNT